MRTLRELSDRYEKEGLSTGLLEISCLDTLGNDVDGAGDLGYFVFNCYMDDGDLINVTELFDGFLEALSSWLEVDVSTFDSINKGEVTFNEYDFTGFVEYANSVPMIEQLRSIERYMLTHGIAEVIFYKED